MFVGVGASRVRDCSSRPRRTPCIIFIDEIDAVGRHRGAGLGGGNDEREQTLNQLLVEMDGFEANEGIILIAATNRPDVLDPLCCAPPFRPAGDRPNTGRGRPRTNPQGPCPQDPGGARREPQGHRAWHPRLSGADLANLCNEAALMAARRNKRMVTMQEFEDAKDKVMMGAERRSLVMTEDEKMLTAYHEGGHAIVAPQCSGHGPGPQGHHHSARPRARHGHAASLERTSSPCPMSR